MIPRHVHVVGAGLAGLAAALSLSGARVGVTLYEAAPQAGGRCRSLYDSTLDRVVDNGSHLMLSCNHAVREYLGEIGAGDEVVADTAAALAFFDLRDRRHWTIRPGALPFGLPFPFIGRPPGAPLGRSLRSLWRLARAGSATTVAAAVADDPAADTLWYPLALAILNTEPEAAAAAPLARVLRAALARGAATCRPMIARHSLSRSFVDPALALLATRGGTFLPHRRLRAASMGNGRISVLDFGATETRVGPDEAVILALPAGGLAGVLPAAAPSPAAPSLCRAIVNVHYRLPRAATLPGGGRFLGLVGGTAQWLFVRDDVASVTVSAAPDALLETPGRLVAAALWPEVAIALSIDPAPCPPARTIKERRATPAHTPEHEARRPRAVPAPATNLRLAGDWTHPVWPATIEAAVDSGRRAARALLADP